MTSEKGMGGEEYIARARDSARRNRRPRRPRQASAFTVQRWRIPSAGPWAVADGGGHGDDPRTRRTEPLTLTPNAERRTGSSEPRVGQCRRPASLATAAVSSAGSIGFER